MFAHLDIELLHLAAPLLWDSWFCLKTKIKKIKKKHKRQLEVKKEGENLVGREIKLGGKSSKDLSYLGGFNCT